MQRLIPLRRRFIATNMLTITVLLLLIFTIVIGGNLQYHRNIATEALHMLLNSTNPMNKFGTEIDINKFQDANRTDRLTIEQSTSDNNPMIPPPSGNASLSAQAQKSARTLPGIVILRNDDADSSEIIFSRNMDTTAKTASTIAQEALATGKMEGTLLQHKLSYMIRKTPEGTKIAFIDRASELSALLNLLVACLFGFIVAWLLFFLVVWRLSHWAFRPVEEAWAQQRQFIADASHELKTPLTVLLANLQILKNHPQHTIAQEMRWIDTSNQEALRMKKLVADMLLLAQNDANNHRIYNAKDINFSDLVFSVLLSFESVALEHNLAIEETISPDLHLKGDSSQLRELITILLDNACKYAPSGSIITLTLKQQDKKIYLCVHNASTPFSADELNHLFERFYRADASRTRQTGGYGLGLAIAQSICQCHHGIIKAFNDDNGITFQIAFPLL